MPRVGVSLVDLPLPLPLRDDAANDSRGGSTDKDGWFEISAPMPPGSWPLRLSGRGVSLVRPHDFSVVAPARAGDENVLRVWVERMPAIEGHVFDENGQPLRGIYIQALPGAGQWMTSAYSRADGSFSIFKRDGSPDEVRLEIEDPGPCEPIELRDVYSWGTAGVVVRLQRALSFELTVVEQGSGRPVEQYSVQCYARGRNLSSRFTDLRLGGRDHKEGVATVDKVWRGDNRLLVVPRDRTLGLSPVIDFFADDDLAARTVELERLEPVSLKIVDVQGVALNGADVWIVDHPGGQAFPLNFGLFQDPRGSRVVWTSGDAPCPWP